MLQYITPQALPFGFTQLTMFFQTGTTERGGLSYPDDRRDTGNCPLTDRFIGELNFFNDANLLIGSE